MAKKVMAGTEDISAKTKEQQKYILEFFSFAGGCGAKEMDVADYKAAVKARKDAMNIKNRALGKLGIDEDQAKEIPPVEFEGYSFEKGYRYKKGVTSLYEVTWLFFTDSQVYAYSIMFDMTADTVKERTEEYFYKDVTNFSSATDSVEVMEYVSKKGCNGQITQEQKKTMVETSKFSIVVPGDKFSCAMETKGDIESRIQAMKQKLREKKA